MLLFEPTRLVDQALEHAAHGGLVDWWASLLSEPGQHPALPVRIVHFNAALTFDVTHAQHQAHALRQEFQNLRVYGVNCVSKLR